MAPKKNKKTEKEATEKEATKEPAKGKKDQAKGKGKDKKAKAKAPKKDEKPTVIEVPHKKKDWMLERAINPATGTRFKPGTNGQFALELAVKLAKEGKTVKEIREELKNTRRENGASGNLDAGYFNLAVACNPEFFKVWSDGKIEIVKEPEPDPKAAEEMAEKEAKRKERASKARGKKVTKKPAKVEGKAKGKGKPKRILKKKK